jgi:hypothetical protein
MRTLAQLTFGVLAVIVTASTASADVHLTIRGGRVTLIARDATVRQILAEWERVGQTKVINADRIAGGPLNLELTNVPEQQALDVLLRSVSGVVLAPRAGTIDNLSAFERIIVMPPSIAPQPLNNTAPAIAQAPFQPQQRLADEEQDDRPNRGGPVFAFPQPQNPNPQMPNLPVPNAPPGGFGGPQQQPALVFPQPPIPGAPPPVIPAPGVSTGQPAVGVSVPGMVAPVPAPVPGPPGFPPPSRPQNP